VIWRLTYFVNEARKTDEGWLVLGEPGLGPPELGDQFDGVHHQDDGSEDVGRFRVLALQEGSMSIAGPPSVRLRRDDILIGEVER